MTGDRVAEPETYYCDDDGQRQTFSIELVMDETVWGVRTFVNTPTDRVAVDRAIDAMARKLKEALHRS